MKDYNVEEEAKDAINYLKGEIVEIIKQINKGEDTFRITGLKANIQVEALNKKEEEEEKEEMDISTALRKMLKDVIEKIDEVTDTVSEDACNHVGTLVLKNKKGDSYTLDEILGTVPYKYLADVARFEIAGESIKVSEEGWRIFRENSQEKDDDCNIMSIEACDLIMLLMSDKDELAKTENVLMRFMSVYMPEEVVYLDIVLK
jgi:hypothetical protein